MCYVNKPGPSHPGELLRPGRASGGATGGVRRKGVTTTIPPIIGSTTRQFPTGFWKWTQSLTETERTMKRTSVSAKVGSYTRLAPIATVGRVLDKRSQ